MSVVSGLAGAGANIFAAQQQADTAKAAQEMQWKMFSQVRSDLGPFMQGGQNAFSTLSNLMGNGGPGASANMLAGLRNYPGYQFALQQGQQGIDRGMAARGLGLSGGEMKDSSNYNQGMADQLFGQYFNQQMGMAQLGEGAAAGVGAAGQTAATNAGEAGMWGSQQMARGITGAANDLFGQNGATSGMNWGDVSNFFNGGTNSGGADPVWSDRRLKDEIAPIGELPSGLPVYHFKYKGSDLPQVGVMADEVRKIAPRAVHRSPSGFDRVDYGAISRLPARVASDLPAFKEAA